MILHPKQEKLQRQMLSKWKFGLFKIFKLPLAYITGIKLLELTPAKAVASVKYKYINTNPFKSLYFAVLAMTAELSTGALALFTIAKHKKSIAVLVVESHGKFYKKATGKINFVCEDGERFDEIISHCVEQDSPETLVANTKGYNEQNELVCEYNFTWSFKVRD